MGKGKTMEAKDAPFGVPAGVRLRRMEMLLFAALSDGAEHAHAELFQAMYPDGAVAPADPLNALRVQVSLLRGALKPHRLRIDALRGAYQLTGPRELRIQPEERAA